VPLLPLRSCLRPAGAILSLGARAWRNGARADYNVEAIAQFGTFGDSRIRAWTVASEAGLRAGAGTRARIGLRADITSGDSDPYDRTLSTFNAMFPRGAYFGLVSPVGPANHIDIHPQVTFAPRRNVAITGRWLFLWRHQTTDGIYSNSGILLRRALNNERFVGQSPGLEVELTTARRVAFTASLAAFSVGSFLKSVSPARTTVFFSAWTTYRF
jgi:Alginate export